MKDIWRQSFIYYLAAPVILLIWPLLLYSFYLPKIDTAWEKEAKIFNDARSKMNKILTLDPERSVIKEKGRDSKFDYSNALNAAASKLGIRAGQLDIRVKKVLRSEGGKTQDCPVGIEDIDIVTFAKFISNLQVTWANLQIEKITLTKKEGSPDSWKADVTFKYFF
jgi:hypothetical protein